MKPLLAAVTLVTTLALTAIPVTTADAFVDGGSTPDRSCLTTMKTKNSGNKLVFYLKSKCESKGGPYGAINVGVTVSVKGKTYTNWNIISGGPSSVTTRVKVPNPPGTQRFDVMVETVGYGAYNTAKFGGIRDYYLLFLHTTG